MPVAIDDLRAFRKLFQLRPEIGNRIADGEQRAFGIEARFRIEQPRIDIGDFFIRVVFYGWGV